MKKIAVFTDLSNVSGKAVEYAAFIAKNAGSAIVLLHINSSGDSAAREKAEKALKDECQRLENDGIRATCHIGEGAFFANAQNELETIMPWMCVVATHGKVGLRQHLLGSNILRLVRNISYPAIVLQEDTIIPQDGIKRILFPPGAHHNFIDKIRVTAEIAKIFGSHIDIYNIIKGGEVRSENFLNNIAMAKAYFDEAGISFGYITEEATFYSAGFSRQTVAYIKQHRYDLVSIMAATSGENLGISDADKENLLLNTEAVPVLCV